MDNEQTYDTCPYCGQWVKLDESGIVYGRAQVDVTGDGQTREWADGLGAYFHAACPPEAVGYARRPPPGSDSAP